jgi:hypothetical protein
MRQPRVQRLSAAAAVVVIVGLSTATAFSAGAADAGSQAGPRNDKAPSITGLAVKGRILAAHNGSWSGAGPITYTVRWLHCDVNDSGCTPIRGATADTHMLTSSDVGFRIRLRVTAADSDGSASAVAAATTTVTATAGAVTSAPLDMKQPSIMGAAVEGQILAAGRGSWTGAGTISYTYQWLRCDGNGVGCIAIAEATSSSYALTAAELGSRLRVEVTATNGGGSARAQSNATPAVTKVGATTGVPTSTKAPSVAGSPVLGQALLASPGLWSGTLPIAFSYQWLRCGAAGKACAAVPGETAIVHVVGDADLGHTLRALVIGTSTSGTSNATSAPTPKARTTGGPAPYGATRLPSGRLSVPATSVSLPQQLVIDRVVFTPDPVRSRARPILVRVHVSDTRRYVVRGALVFVRSVPVLTSTPGERRTGRDGWVTFRVTLLPDFPLPPGHAIQFFVRTRKRGDGALVGVGVRRLVQVRIAMPA